jgi:hypothetical protein
LRKAEREYNVYHASSIVIARGNPSDIRSTSPSGGKNASPNRRGGQYGNLARPAPLAFAVVPDVRPPLTVVGAAAATAEIGGVEERWGWVDDNAAILINYWVGELIKNCLIPLLTLRLVPFDYQQQHNEHEG